MLSFHGADGAHAGHADAGLIGFLAAADPTPAADVLLRQERTGGWTHEGRFQKRLPEQLLVVGKAVRTGPAVRGPQPTAAVGDWKRSGRSEIVSPKGGSPHSCTTTHEPHTTLRTLGLQSKLLGATLSRAARTSRPLSPH